MLRKIDSLLENPTWEIQTTDYPRQFKDALKDDLNTANAITVLYDVLKDEQLTNRTKLSLIKEFDQVLSLNLLDREEEVIEDELKTYILAKIEERKQAKENKNYDLADQSRKELEEKNIFWSDTREGPTCEIKE